MPLIDAPAHRTPRVATLSRRSFLLDATTGTAAIGAALIIKKEPQPSHRPDLRAASKSGYQVTEHVRNYYRTAKV
jgi:hypothetical protein